MARCGSAAWWCPRPIGAAAWGAVWVQEALDWIPGQFGALPVALAAQAHLERLYAGFGFIRTSEQYLDEGGIPHVDMQRPSTAPVTG